MYTTNIFVCVIITHVSDVFLNFPIETTVSACIEALSFQHVQVWKDRHAGVWSNRKNNSKQTKALGKQAFSQNNRNYNHCIFY